MEVTIKNVPAEIVNKVEEIILLAIERHLRESLAPSELDIQNFEDNVNSVYVANGRPPKYEEEQIEK